MGSILDDIKNAFRNGDNALVQLILLNVLVFAILHIAVVIDFFSKSDTLSAFLQNNLYMPAHVDAFLQKPWTLITYYFSHMGLLHILFNMLFLYWFGRIVHEFIGNKRVVSLYILGGIAGGLTYLILFNTLEAYRDMSGSMMLGASASVYAIVVGAATLVPEYRIYLIFLGPVKIKYIAAFHIFISFIGIAGPNAGGNLAHLGGAVLGYIFIRQLRRGNDIGKPVTATLNWAKNLFKAKPKIKVSYSAPGKKTPPAKASDPSQEEIDVILDKISQSGYESLTKEEKQKLFTASQRQEK